MTKLLNEPEQHQPDKTWKHFKLFQKVKSALLSLPIHFDTETYIEGISAADIFTLNSALGATIENQVVNTLNQMRSIWDPDGNYALYNFKRQSQTFPDVLFKGQNGDIIMGIELKGWYLLSKEGEPSFRYQVTPAACTKQDLLVVVPWALKNIISGSPQVFLPYVIPAKYAAELRNYHWTHKRIARTDPNIDSPQGISPYPSKTDQILDRPRSDAGGNFGRYARTGIMDDFVTKAKHEPLCGIPAEYWLHFFKIFVEQRDGEAIKDHIEKLRKKVETIKEEEQSDKKVSLQIILDNIENLMNYL
jgi:hypothetical protein